MSRTPRIAAPVGRLRRSAVRESFALCLLVACCALCVACGGASSNAGAVEGGAVREIDPAEAQSQRASQAERSVAGQATQAAPDATHADENTQVPSDATQALGTNTAQNNSAHKNSAQADASSTRDSAVDDPLRHGVGVPSGILRAQAWPSTDDNDSWRALEHGEGHFMTSEGAGGRRFVFSSLEDSMPTRGILIDIPNDVPAENVPTSIAVAISPTPIRVTRDAWPSIASVFRAVGIARVQTMPGRTLYIEFETIERVSLLQLQLWTSAQRGRIGVGRVRLVHQRARVNMATAQRIALTPLQDADTLPQDAGVLGADESITLPHRTRSQ